MHVTFTFSSFFFPTYTGVPGGRPDFFASLLVKRVVTVHPLKGVLVDYLIFLKTGYPLLLGSKITFNDFPASATSLKPSAASRMSSLWVIISLTLICFC